MSKAKQIHTQHGAGRSGSHTVDISKLYLVDLVLTGCSRIMTFLTSPWPAWLGESCAFLGISSLALELGLLLASSRIPIAGSGDDVDATTALMTGIARSKFCQLRSKQPSVGAGPDAP